MGRMNLLTASWEGAVGKTVGQKWKNKHVIKARVDGKAPANEAQTNALLVFGQLQRVIRQIQTVIQPTIYNPSPKMTEQNLWVHLSKAAVAGGVFNPAGILGPKGKLETFRDVILTYNPTTGILHGERNTPLGWNDPQGKVVWVTFFDGETMLYPLVIQSGTSLNYTFSIGERRTGTIWSISMWQRPGSRTKLYSQLVATVATIVTQDDGINQLSATISPKDTAATISEPQDTPQKTKTAKKARTAKKELDQPPLT